MIAIDLKKTGSYRLKKLTGPITRQPKDLNQLRKLLDPAAGMPLPIRPQGSGTAATDCNASATGTTLRTTNLNRIVHVDTYNHTVTAQAGVRLETLVK